ncbi:MAG: DNA methyltransferase, partial [Pseudomonadota bacterium]
MKKHRDHAFRHQASQSFEGLSKKDHVQGTRETPASFENARKSQKPTEKIEKLIEESIEHFLGKVMTGDCSELARRLPAKSVDLVFADPPYNLQLRNDLTRPNGSQVEGVDNDWDKFDHFADYDAFTTKWIREMRRLLKPDGAMWV